MSTEDAKGLRKQIYGQVLAKLSGHDLQVLGELTTAVAALDPAPRTQRWRSLTYCILDAVWSIGARYDSVVVPLVRRVAAEHGDGDPLVPVLEPLPPDPAPLHAFLSRFSDRNPLSAHTNRQRTSPRGGSLKADVAQAHARVFVDHGVNTLHDIDVLIRDRQRCEHVDATLRRLPGEGQHGVRRNYLWMLTGDEDLVKPDRMVLAWLARHGVETDALGATLHLRLIAQHLTASGRPITPWEVDHAIWSAERLQRTVGRTRP